MNSKFFHCKEITTRTFCITGLGLEQAFLLEGNDKAALVDTLIGVGNLKAFCRELTDKPITVINTHGHVDHVGGNFDFEQCFIAPEDITLLYTQDDRRKVYVEAGMRKAGRHTTLLDDDFSKIKPIKTLPLNNGWTIDLGNRRLEAVAVPGHTHGSTVIIDQLTRIAFTGDACSNNTLLYLPHSTSVKTYQQSLLKLKEKQTSFDVLWGGHCPKPLDKIVVDEAIELCQEIIERKDDKVPGTHLGFHCLYAKLRNEAHQRKDGKIANIAYSADQLESFPLRGEIPDQVRDDGEKHSTLLLPY
jgi:glyoxylase-like metal-dependent hydrolase (beta-lactamase superfamily II)